jgi:hypothetical protein
MDDFHVRALKNLRERHETKIRQLAESIQQEIGYTLTRLDSGHKGSASIGHYAGSIATDAQEIVTRLAALEAMTDATEILETREEQK